jgi:hypothetical protein
LTLTNTSTQYQIVQINSLANSIVILPNATTLATKGYPPFVIENSSPIGANLQVQNSTGAVVGYLGVGQVGLFTLLDNSTSAGSWECSTASTQSFFNYNTASLTTNTVTWGLIGFMGLSPTSFIRYGYAVTGWAGQPNGTITASFQAATISGNTITFGTTQTFSFLSISTAGFQYYLQGDIIMQAVRLSDSSFTVFMGASYRASDGADSYVGIKNFRTCTVSGTTFTFGSSSTGAVPQNATRNTNGNLAGAVPYNGTLARLSDTSFALIFNNAITNAQAATVNFSGSLAAQIVTVSGTTQTVGTAVALGTSTYTQPLSIAAISATSLFVAYGQATAGNYVGRTNMNVVSISGTVPTWGTSVTIENADRTVFGSYWGAVNYAIASSATQVIFQTNYSTCVASISGTTPTFVSTPYTGILYQIYLTTSSKAYSVQGRYLSIATGGFVISGNITSVNDSGYPNVAPQSPLGATPTTAFITSDNTNHMLGNAL